MNPLSIALIALRIALALIPGIKAGIAEFHKDNADGVISHEDVADITMTIIRTIAAPLLEAIGKEFKVAIPPEVTAVVSEATSP